MSMYKKVVVMSKNVANMICERISREAKNFQGGEDIIC